MPSSETSRPASSASSETRIPMIAFRANQTISEAPKVIKVEFVGQDQGLGAQPTLGKGFVRGRSRETSGAGSYELHGGWKQVGDRCE